MKMKRSKGISSGTLPAGWCRSWIDAANSLQARIVLILVLMSAVAPVATAQDALQTLLRSQLLALERGEQRQIGGVQIAAHSFLPKLYAALGHNLAWREPSAIIALQSAVASSWEDGFLPSDFHAEIVAATSVVHGSPKSQIERDIILSDALVRLLYQLYFGKVDPSAVDARWNFSRPVLSTDPAATIAEALKSGDVAALIDRIRLEHPYYLALKSALATHAKMSLPSGWQPIPAGRAIKPGDRDPRVGAVRLRLHSTSHARSIGSSADQDLYDEGLAAAIRAFQDRNGLAADGIIGPATLAVLNITPKQLMDRIRVNLERARWVLRSTLGNDMVVVNIAGFYLRLIIDRRTAWQTRVVVGRTYHKTPVFTETLKTIVFNPDWTLPRSIVRGEKFAKMSTNPSYLAANDYELRDNSGRTVDPYSVDWSRYTASTFPYGMIQKPGVKNALGLVKFLFPNKYAVYLHDTPNRELFSKSGRTFSHGCVRVESPLKLAELILKRDQGWSRSRIDNIVASRKTGNVKLRKPVPVLLLYWTADPVTTDGTVRFFPDIYGRDERVLRALNSAFKPSGKVQ